MTNRDQNIVLSCILVVVAAVWTWLVIATIPPGFGGGEIGARAFPLTFGVILLVLSALLLMRLFIGKHKNPTDGDAKSPQQTAGAQIDWWPAITVFGEIILYGFLLEKIGFTLATPVIVLLLMVVNLRVRSPRLLAGMVFGVTFGCWLVFEKIFGIYMANGMWINLG